MLKKLQCIFTSEHYVQVQGALSNTYRNFEMLENVQCIFTCVHYAHNCRTSGNMTKTAPTPQAALSPEAAVPPHAAAPSGTPHDILEGIANYEDLDSVSLSNEDISLEDHLSEGAGVSPVSTVSLGGAPPSRSAPRSSVPSSCSGSTQSRPSKKRKEMDDPLYAHINDISQKMATWKPLDSDEHFALSLVNYMQKVKEQEKLEMRMKVLQVIKDYTN